MVKYSSKPANDTKTAMCRVDDLRCHYKNIYNVARACRGMNVVKAIAYMENVLEHKAIDSDKCMISHVCVQRAVSGRRRTYRAHGRISPYLSSNAHVEFICTEQSGP